MGIPKEEIQNFSDPYHWIRYFPSLAKEDLISFGSSVDWRRSFITTDENPYFNSFIEWHLTKLREAGYVKFGKRPSIFSA
jgi:leucyl-tRNA synthetase